MGRTPEKRDIHMFLNGLHIKNEELATVTVKVDEKDYLLMVIGPLPLLASYANSFGYRAGD